MTLLTAGCSFGGTETAPATPTTETTPTTTTTMRPAESPVVKANKEVQEDPAGLGFYDGPVNGVYGPRTTAAVKRFQARAGLPVDGIAGTQTMGAINLALANDSTHAEDLLQTTPEGALLSRRERRWDLRVGHRGRAYRLPEGGGPERRRAVRA